MLLAARTRLSSRAAATVRLSFFFFSSRRRHTRSDRDWSSDVCSSDLPESRVAQIEEACIADDYIEADGEEDVNPGQHEHGAPVDRAGPKQAQAEERGPDRKSVV